ncbi:MAG: hypothetical protein VYB22_04445, partial [Pseudomonadota bacterium]|nr:hypothetical protein [Pseudomonadota bacterium]
CCICSNSSACAAPATASDIIANDNVFSFIRVTSILVCYEWRDALRFPPQGQLYSAFTLNSLGQTHWYLGNISQSTTEKPDITARIAHQKKSEKSLSDC